MGSALEHFRVYLYALWTESFRKRDIYCGPAEVPFTAKSMGSSARQDESLVRTVIAQPGLPICNSNIRGTGLTLYLQNPYSCVEILT